MEEDKPPGTLVSNQIPLRRTKCFNTEGMNLKRSWKPKPILRDS